jgi:hypothetical protein
LQPEDRLRPGFAIRKRGARTGFVDRRATRPKLRVMTRRSLKHRGERRHGPGRLQSSMRQRRLIRRPATHLAQSESRRLQVLFGDELGMVGLCSFRFGQPLIDRTDVARSQAPLRDCQDVVSKMRELLGNRAALACHRRHAKCNDDFAAYIPRGEFNLGIQAFTELRRRAQSTPAFARDLNRLLQRGEEVDIATAASLETRSSANTSVGFAGNHGSAPARAARAYAVRFSAMRNAGAC